MTAVTQRGTAVTKSGSGSSMTLTVSTGTVAGDRIVLAVSVDDDGAYSAVTANVGSGRNFTALGHAGGGSPAEWLTVFERIVQAGDSSTITITIPSGSDHYAVTTSWQNTDTGSSCTLGTFANTASASAVPAVTVGSADDYTLLCSGTNNISRPSVPSGWTVLGSNGGAEVDGKAFGAAGSTGTVTPSWSGSGEFVAALVNIPAVTGGGSTPVADTDTITGTDTQSIAAALTQTDTATGSDTQSIVASATQTDSLTGTEATPNIKQTLTDAITGTEGTPSIKQTQTDSVTASDSQTIAASRTQTDAVTGTETWSIQVSITQTDTITGSDSQSVTVAGAGPGTVTDAAAATDSQSIVATQTQTDSIAATEATPNVKQTTTDSVTATEAQAKIAQQLADQVTVSESWSIVVRITQTDGVTLTDTESNSGNVHFVDQTDTVTFIEGWSVHVIHPAPGAPGFTRLTAFTLSQRLESMNRNSRPRPVPVRWRRGL